MNEDLKHHFRKKLFEAFGPDIADEEGVNYPPIYSPVPKPYILPNGEYSWYPHPLPPIRHLLSPIENEFDRQTNDILLWINTLNGDDLTDEMLQWLIWVLANSDNLSLPNFMTPEINDRLGRELLENFTWYRHLFFSNILDRLENIFMNNMNIQDRIRLLSGLIDRIEDLFPNDIWSEIVDHGLIDWPHLQHIMPYGWYPSDPWDQLYFFNDPYIQPWPGMPLKLPTSIPWWKVDWPPEPPNFDDEDAFI